MTLSRRTTILLAVTALGSPVATALADGPGQRLELGLRAGAQSASSAPLSDILAVGIYGHWRLDERWRIGLAIDRSECDLEIANIAGLSPAPVARDASASFTTVSVWMERAHAAWGRHEWFWTAGVGGAAVDVATIRGTRQGGGTYEVSTSIDGEIGVEEVIVSIGGGLRLRLGSSDIVLALHADRHIADWEVFDRVSGSSARIDDFSVGGVSVGWNYRF